MTDQTPAIDYLLSVGACPMDINLTLVDREVTGHAYVKYGDYKADAGAALDAKGAYRTAAFWFEDAATAYGEAESTLSGQIRRAFWGDMLDAALEGAASGLATGIMAKTSSRTFITDSGQIVRMRKVYNIPYSTGTDTRDQKTRRKAYKKKVEELNQLANSYVAKGN